MENKIPPPIVAIAMLALMFILDFLQPTSRFVFNNAIIVSVVFAIISASIMLAGIWEFRRAKTTVNPLQPEKASSLVDGGIFSFTRNPMYLGMLGILIAGFLYLSNSINALPIISFFLFISRYQISPEERAMLHLFPTDYPLYCQRVRRWV